jgi:hypothetical protein
MITYPAPQRRCLVARPTGHAALISHGCKRPDGDVVHSAMAACNSIDHAPALRVRRVDPVTRAAGAAPTTTLSLRPQATAQWRV